MKNKDAAEERQGRALEGRQSENTSVNTRDENTEEHNHQEKDKKVKDLHNRARKSYHNDGPGGGYRGL